MNVNCRYNIDRKLFSHTCNGCHYNRLGSRNFEREKGSKKGVPGYYFHINTISDKVGSNSGTRGPRPVTVGIQYGIYILVD